MSRIRILSEETVNKVAAGEVVERPAAALKELLENSLDAGALNIDVLLEGAGKKLIRVRDDGEGMTHDEALLALERHSTSKIGSAGDLDRIGTFGFRGEALPSMAAVSRMQIVTRPAGAAEGTKVVLQGGAVRKVQPCGAPPGTEIEVRDLFRNVPARLKFLRSNPTELAHCVSTAARLALANPRTGFTLAHGPRRLLALQPAGSEGERLRDHLGEEFFGQLLPFEKTAGEVRLRGYLAKPGRGRAGGDYQQLFVNGRPVRDPILARAVRDACSAYFQGGRDPLSWFVWIDLPPGDVDVNVHPTKREVRFRRPGDIGSLLAESLRGLLREDRLAPFASAAPGPAAGTAERPGPYRPSPPEAGQLPLAPGAGTGPAPPEAQPAGGMQLFGTYLVMPGEDGLMLVDQHAAHERVMFEKVLDTLEAGASQRLLHPVLLDLTAGEAEILEELAPKVEGYGIEVERFGPRTFRLLALPLRLPPEEAAAFLREVVERVRKEAGAPEIPDFLRELAALLACHGSVRARRRLAAEETRALLRDLFLCRDPAHCPHGRPTFITIDRREIEKRFGRT